jgi:phosphoglycolate phosphatase
MHRSGKNTSRLVVFDFDGTLADTWRDLASALNETLSEAGLAPVSGPDVKSWVGDGALKLLSRALPPHERSGPRLEAHFERFRVHYERCCLDTTELYPGMDACLEALSDEAALAVLSNKPMRFLDRIVEGLDIGKRFFAIVGGDSLAVTKPDPHALRSIAARLDAEPGEIWMIGDSAIDVATGRAAGARTIGCAWGLRGIEELRAAGADALAHAPEEIPPLVLGDVPRSARLPSVG